MAEEWVVWDNDRKESDTMFGRHSTYCKALKSSKIANGFLQLGTVVDRDARRPKPIAPTGERCFDDSGGGGCPGLVLIPALILLLYMMLA